MGEHWNLVEAMTRASVEDRWDGAVTSIRQYWDNASFGQALQADHGD